MNTKILLIAFFIFICSHNSQTNATSFLNRYLTYQTPLQQKAKDLPKNHKIEFHKNLLEKQVQKELETQYHLIKLEQAKEQLRKYFLYQMKYNINPVFIGK